MIPALPEDELDVMHEPGRSAGHPHTTSTENYVLKSHHEGVEKSVHWGTVVAAVTAHSSLILQVKRQKLSEEGLKLWAKCGKDIEEITGIHNV